MVLVNKNTYSKSRVDAFLSKDKKTRSTMTNIIKIFYVANILYHINYHIARSFFDFIDIIMVKWYNI